MPTRNLNSFKLMQIKAQNQNHSLSFTLTQLKLTVKSRNNFVLRELTIYN